MAVFAYGAFSYAVGFAALVYSIGFVGNLLVPKSMDSPADGNWQANLTIDAALLGLFAIQHSGMARAGFKRRITRVLAPAIERSTYVLVSGATLIFLFWQWRPLGGIVWNVTSEAARAALYGAYACGWLLVVATTFAIDHFDLFGLRQVWRYLAGQEQRSVHFVIPLLYRVVRHPLYLGLLFAFWCTPTMTVTHLVFALGTTAYILVGIRLEERDLLREHPAYREYRRSVPMIIPRIPTATRSEDRISPSQIDGLKRSAQ